MSSIQNQLTVTIFLVVLLFIIKPSIVFKPNDSIREYGVGVDDQGYKKTLFSVHFIIIIMAALVYLFYKTKN